MQKTEKYLDIALKYDEKTVSHFIPKKLRKNVRILQAKGIEPINDLERRFTKVLLDPLGMDQSFEEFMHQNYVEGENVTILVDDHTRPNVHTKIILPKLFKKLHGIGIQNRDIRILVSSGTHRPPSLKEVKEEVLGKEIYKNHKDRVLIHDCDENNRKIGESKEGTPILIDERLLNSAVIIPVTDSEYHYFAGVAGTIKELIPGNAGRETIRKNHPKMFHLEKGFKEGVAPGSTERNPVITEIKDMARKVAEEVNIFCIDCIMNEGEIASLSAGDIITCHEEAKRILPKLSEVKVNELGDLVIVSAGSLGVNLYQAGKAFHAGWHAVKKNKESWIIVLASCKDGFGKEAFAEAVKEVEDMDVDSAMKHLLETRCTEENFQIGDQKPIDLLRIRKTVGEDNLKIISEMNHDDLKLARLVPLKDPDESPTKALQKVIKKFTNLHKDPTIYLIRNPSLLTVKESSS